MYDLLTFKYEYANELLSMLGLTPDSVGRYRDCYLSKDGKKIIVYTRMGGPNRDDYKYEIWKLQKHKMYIKDYDDDWDVTFSSFEFSIPFEHMKRVKELFETADTRTGAEKVQDAFKEMEDNPDKFNEEHPEHVKLIKQLDALASGDDLSEPVVIGGVTIVPVGGKNER